MMQLPARLPYLTLSCVLWLSACGGGGSGSSSSSANISPTANAGNDKTVDEQTLVQLNGTASDPDGSVRSTVWSQDSGLPVNLINSNSLSASFNAPTVTEPEELVFSLTVTDNAGATASDQVTINVSPVNVAPTVDVIENFGVYEQERVELTGDVADSDGSINAYLWEQISGPPVTLNTPSQLATTFDAPPDGGRLEFKLTVTDNESAQTSDQVKVDVFRLAEFGGPVVQDTLLWGAYEITADLILAPNTKLTIHPGTVLKFPQNSSFSVAGQLVSNGTGSEPIFFTHLQSSDITPRSSWSGLELFDSANFSIEYSVIENASAGLRLNGISPVFLQNNVFRENTVAITDDSGFQTMEVSRNTFARNTSVFDGIRLSGMSLFFENIFIDNPSVFSSGYYLDATRIEQNSFEGAALVVRAPEMADENGTVSATNNWWGTTSEIEIASLITDVNDDATLQLIVFTPILNSPPPMAGSSLPSNINFARPDYIWGTPVPAESAPPSQAPTSLTVVSTFNAVMLSWVDYMAVQYTEIWRSAEDDLSKAVIVHTTRLGKWVDYADGSGSFYYWVRDVGTNGAHSAFNDTAGTRAQR